MAVQVNKFKLIVYCSELYKKMFKPNNIEVGFPHNAISSFRSSVSNIFPTFRKQRAKNNFSLFCSVLRKGRQNEVHTVRHVNLRLWYLRSFTALQTMSEERKHRKHRKKLIITHYVIYIIFEILHCPEGVPQYCFLFASQEIFKQDNAVFSF